MADDNSSEKTKQINTSKIEELEVTGHESSPVKENDPKRDLQAEKSAWGEEEQAKLDSLIDNIESRRSKLLELNRNIQELSGKKIDRMGAVSYSEAQIKESIDSLIKNLEGIKKVNSLEVKGKGDFMEIKADINAEKETFLKVSPWQVPSWQLAPRLFYPNKKKITKSVHRNLNINTEPSLLNTSRRWVVGSKN